ncbi:hypothetical protein PRUPE_6G168600 [Prunus persica]|uniref:Spatacsin C-terminal domain-containing protein n=1 Tax=Prunus persica TaxID=3760 RepID=A0A251NRJ4_PRUPE|nr:hypothetical protein PRUPE_6G168600 [Prunus persica]ONI01942.1 hypothetical protein PRUPE_6G168600 [Prunus persica]
MDLSLGDKGPAILQLHKWGSSQAQLNLSEFREAFISPTRQLLLLLSYQCEALLIPLITGNSTASNNLESNSDESLQSPGSSAFCSQDLTAPGGSDSGRGDMPCTSGSTLDFDNDFTFQREISRSKTYPFVGDVNSLAWGICEDTYNQHKDALFSEILFVSGKQGVMVHAFVESTGNTAGTRNALEGRWVEWGPSVSLVDNMDIEEPSSLSCEATGNIDLNRANGNSVASKRWLQSFLTKVENVEYNGSMLTRFPEKSLFPCSAKVVSFALFNSNLPILDFLSNTGSVPSMGCGQERGHTSESDKSVNLHLTSSGQHFKSEILSNIFGVGMNTSYKCSRVFSSNSHYFIGFVFTQTDPASDESERSNNKNVLLVARLDRWGIQWVSSVKLDEGPKIRSVVEWIDFHFSDNLLVCLNASGLIVFYAVMSGEYVAHLDILQTLGLYPQLDFQKQETVSVGSEKHSLQVDGVDYKPVLQCGDYSGRRIFKRLIAASHTSLIAAVDDFGVIYVISAGDYIPDKYYTNEKLLPHGQHLGLGMLAAWEVGGSDIGHQRVYSNISASQKSIIPSMKNERSSFLDDCGNNVLKQEGKGSSCLSGFSASSKVTDQKCYDSEKKSHLMRKIFLPTYRFSEDDSICFSPLGITRLIKNHNLKDPRGSQIVHLNLHAEPAVHDDNFLNSGCEMVHLQGKEESFIGEAVGCTFQGCFYLVTEGGLSVVLPSVSVSSNFLPVEVIGCRQLCIDSGIGYPVKNAREIKESKQPWSPWNVEILDRVLLYESAEEADRLCLENGWNLKISRMRRLQLALDYLKFDEIERSLEMLVGVNFAEEGVLRLLFAAVYLMIHKVGNDNEISAASRLLALATCFSTKMIRKYWLLEHKTDAYEYARTQMLLLPPVVPQKVQDEISNSRRLREMAHFLEIIRNLQSRLGSKYKRPGQEFVESGEESTVVDNDLSQDESQLSIISVDPKSLETSKQHEAYFPVSTSGFNYSEKLALTPVDPSVHLDSEDLSEVSALVPQGVLPLENPKEMIARWKIDNLDLKAVVNDALLSGRLPLAVLQLHLHRSRDSFSGKEPHDTFTEVRDIGRAIAYDLFLKGESGLAVATLQRLGEDVEASLKQLLFGTVRRSLRMQITEEMSRYGYLGPYEWKILDRISLIERLYPSSSFWKTLHGRQKELMRFPASSSLPKRYNLHLLDSHAFNNFSIECDDIDGVVFGSWTNVNENPSVPMVDEDNAYAGYWAAAAVWFSFYDQRIIDRGDCEWARWLLLSRVKGCEYKASFSNARAIMSCNLVPGSNLSVPEMDEIIRTVDDIAEGGGELAALATLMYASVPIQSCLSSGSVKRNSSTSAQCTLENLRPTLQRFPTLWQAFVSACFGQDATSNFLGPKAKNDYLNWRDNIFFSSVRDTSLLQMLPCWFPKAVRRLIQLYAQGPLGWQSVSGLPVGEGLLHRDIDFVMNVDEDAEISAISLEATIQKHIEEELYNSALEENSLGLEHHLHRGRALAAFNHLLTVRVQKLKSEAQTHGQTNVQADVQTLLGPITESEKSLLSSVMPLAIINFEDSVLVASCALFLELCGFSASMLRIDIAALRRMSSFYKSSENIESLKQLSTKGSAFHAVSHGSDLTESLARALADEHLHQDNSSTAKQKGASNLAAGKQPSRALMLVLQHLEKASLPPMVDGKTCGSWLLSGNGDGIELRSQQKAASHHWNLVTIFCQMHHLPLSTKYLSVLARDNDWVGFLSEAQIGGYPFDTVVQVASKEFSDPRLRIHISTVLKGMQLRRKASSSSYSDTTEKKNEASFPDENFCVPVELFRILAECEKQKFPGEAVLMKAKELSWSILAMIASCFSDVSPISCLTVWLEITAARETSSIKVNDIASRIANNVGAAVEATNSLPSGTKALTFHYNRQNSKRRRLLEPISRDPSAVAISDISNSPVDAQIFDSQDPSSKGERNVESGESINVSSDSDEGPALLSKMVAVLCEQHLFLPLLRAFEMFLPSCSLLPFIRALQAFSQMRLSEASAHLGSFSARFKEESTRLQSNVGREVQIGTSWISSTAIKAADAMLLTCPSPYEKRCLLQLLAATDFGDGGSAAACYRRLFWKINLAEPLLRKDDILHLGSETLDDVSLATALEDNRHWEQARNWARQLEASGGPWKSAVHHVTETQAESMVAEWKEFLWDVPEERIALWGHCQTLFIRYSFPALQAGLFFLKHAEALEKDLPARELHELLLLSLQWLSGMITLASPVYPLHLIREIETKVWLLAVESEAHVKSEGDFNLSSSSRDPALKNSSSIIDRTASIITKMDNHIGTFKNRTIEKHDPREHSLAYHKNQVLDASFPLTTGGVQRQTEGKGYMPLRRPPLDSAEKNTDLDNGSNSLNTVNELQSQDENLKMELSFSRWEERVGPAELERAVLSLLEFGQIAAAKQLQHKLSPVKVPSEFVLVDAALKLAAMSTPSKKVSILMLDEEVHSIIQSYNILTDQHQVDPIQVLESLATNFTEGCGRGLCKRIIAVAKAAAILGISFSEAFDKQPIELLQLLSLKAQESFEEAHLLVRTHSMPAASIAQILSESFLKGLLAAHRGGYMDSQKEEGPAPLLWRFSDFLKWAELCPSEQEIGHSLMRLVITGQEVPHACEVELLILSHHFYKLSSCLDGVDVLVALAATRVEAYVSEGDFSCLARLITGVGNFHALNFILGILIENGQLDLLLQKYSAAADANAGTAEAVRGFRMAVLTSLKHFNPNDLDAFAMVYNHFDMKHETAALLESRAEQSSEQWFSHYDKDQNEDLLDSMRYYIEAAEVHKSIDAGNKTRRACAQASLVSLQIRMPDFHWLYRSETNARRALVEQSRFQEALIVAEAYGLNQPSEWALVLWNQMLKPEVLEEFVAEFVAVLPLQPSMLADLARFYRAEVAARGDQSQFSVWLTGGGLPAEWAKYLGRSFRCLLKRTRDLKLRLQLATVATGFGDVMDACMKSLDRVPDNVGPLVLRKGHGGAYLPLM